MTAGPFVLRDATPADAAALTPLLDQLGYPSTDEQVRERLRRVMARSGCRVRVAELDARPVGLAVGNLGATLTRDEPVARLSLLVTDEAVRGMGAGRALLRDFEAWAVGQGARNAVLTSALRREAAHGFYRAAGWEATGLRFARELRAGS